MTDAKFEEIVPLLWVIWWGGVMTDPVSLARALTDEELRAELNRREREKIDAAWVRAIARAKYLCPFCGGPDGWHDRGCASDALDTCT